MAHDVFISYATEDGRVADAVCKALEEGGVRCWYAPRDVPYLVDYEEAIIDAILQSKLMLLVLSKHANDSAHVKREVQNACREEPQIPVLPFQIENVPLSKSFRYYIGSVQWLVASTPPLEAHLQKLVSYVQRRLPQPEQGGDSGTPEGHSVEAEIVEKDEEEASRYAEEAVRLADEVERRRVEEEGRLAAEAEAQLKAEEERQRRDAEEKRRAEKEETQRRVAAEEEAARLAAEELQREEEEKERSEAEERQRLEDEEAAKHQAEKERVQAEAAARRRADQEEAERLRVAAEQEAERHRLEEEKQARLEEERRQREEEERQKPEAAEITQQREEEARREKERQAEERRASEARFRELNLAARQTQPEEPSTEVTAGDVPTPAYKNRRLMLIGLGALVLIAIVAAVALTGRNDGKPQQQSGNLTATQSSTQRAVPTMNAPPTAEATPTQSPTPEPIPTPDKAAFEKSMTSFIKRDKDMAQVVEGLGEIYKTTEVGKRRRIVYGDLNGDNTEDAAVWFCGDNMGLGRMGFWCKLVAFKNTNGVLTKVSASESWAQYADAYTDLLSITDGKIIVATQRLSDDGFNRVIGTGRTKFVLDGNRLKEVR